VIRVYDESGKLTQAHRARRVWIAGKLRSFAICYRSTAR